VDILEAEVVYSEMIQLRRIDLSNNPDLKQIPWSWGNLTSLEILDMSNTGLITLPYSMCSGQSVESLSELLLGNTPASTKLNWTGQLLRLHHTEMMLASGCDNFFRSNLIELILASNQLECPNSYYSMQQKHIRKFSNESTSLLSREVRVSDQDEECGFAAVGKFKHLELLDLTNNSIKSVRVQLHSLIALNQLSNESSRGVILAGNPITFLDLNALLPYYATRWFKFLQTIDSVSMVKRITTRLLSLTSVKNDVECTKKLDGNEGEVASTCPQLQTLNLNHYDQLEYLILDNNKLTEMDSSLFQNLKHLRYLSMKDNRIPIIPKHLFVNLDKLEFLDVQQNEIEMINSDMFQGLNSLSALFLHRNKLQYLANDTFTTVLSMTILDLSDNQIVSIEIGAFLPLKNLVCLIVWGNPVFKNIQEIGLLFVRSDVIIATDGRDCYF